MGDKRRGRGRGEKNRGSESVGGVSVIRGEGGEEGGRKVNIN